MYCIDMQTSKVQNSTPAFGAKVDTIRVLEAATFKSITRETVSDMKPLIDALWPKKLKGTGNRGYRYYMKAIGDKIVEKYPKVADAAFEILEYTDKHPQYTKKDLQEFVKPIIKELGETLDITI